MSDPKNYGSKFYGNRFISSFVDNDDRPNKKPKLDITVSQASPSKSFISRNSETVNKQLSTEVSKAIHDNDIWGEDLDENDVNQCLLVATQALTQDNCVENNPPTNSNAPKKQLTVGTNNNSKRYSYNSFDDTKGILSNVSSGRTPNKSGTPMHKAASAGNFPVTSLGSSGYSSLTVSSNTKSSKYCSTEGAIIHLESELNKVKEDRKILRDSLQFKEGEVKNLRICLSKHKTEHVNLNKQLLKVREDGAREVADLRKEIKDLKTQLEFKCMESKSLEEKVKQCRDHSSNNYSPNPGSSKSRTSYDLSKVVHFEEKSINNIRLENLPWDVGKLSFTVNEGSLLAKLLEPEIFYLSSSNRSCTSMLKYTLSNKESKADISDSIYNSYGPLMMLFKCESFSNFSARINIKKIINEYCISLQRHLQLMDEEGLENHLVDRSRKLLQNSYAILPLTETYSFLQPKPLYSGERGIEIRRILCVLEVLTRVGYEPAKILKQSFFSTSEKFSNDNKNISEVRKDQENNQSCEKISIFYVLKDLTLLISTERRTLQYNGVLAMAALLLATFVEKQLELTEELQILLLEIVQNILTACPGPTVVLNCCKFLYFANYYQTIVKKLCTNSVDKAEYDGYYKFDKDTCPISVLCYMVQALDHTKRSEITDIITKWFLGLIRKDEAIFSSQLLEMNSSSNKTDKRDCTCAWNLSKVITMLICEAALIYDKERNKLNEKNRLQLERLLKRGLIIIYRMLQHPMFIFNLSSVEGQCDLFVHTISMLNPSLPLPPLESKMLDQLLNKELQEVRRRKNNLNDGNDFISFIFTKERL